MKCRKYFILPFRHYSIREFSSSTIIWLIEWLRFHFQITQFIASLFFYPLLAVLVYIYEVFILWGVRLRNEWKYWILKAWTNNHFADTHTCTLSYDIFLSFPQKYRRIMFVCATVKWKAVSIFSRTVFTTWNLYFIRIQFRKVQFRYFSWISIPELFTFPIQPIPV